MNTYCCSTLCLYIVFCVGVTLMISVDCCSEWHLLTNPVIFGKSAELACTVSNVTQEQSVVTWTGGQEYKTLSYNGAASNKYKVTNSRKGSLFESILEIKNFSEKDVNAYYSCSGGFHENRKKIKLTQENFILFPKSDDVTVFSSFRNGHLDIKFEIRKVFPIPVCTVYLNKTEVTKKVERIIFMDGIFYKLKETIYHDFGKAVCKGNLKITCQIGYTNITIQDQLLNSCTEITQTTTKKHKETDYTILGPTLGVIVLLVVILIVGLVGIFRYNMLRDVLCCNVNWKSPERAEQEAVALIELQNLRDLMKTRNIT